MSEQDSKQATALQRPVNDDKQAWKVYWEQQGQLWRIEPEIDIDRRKYLAERRNITPDIGQGIYPFKDIKLNRADVEWLLATHENGRGPVDWNDQSQRNREGLDLRGAILNEENLSELPLARLLGEIDTRRQVTPTSEFILTTTEQRDMAAVHMEGANLEGTHLEKAKLSRCRLKRANIRSAHLESANLFFAHLEEAFLSRAHLERAVLRGCHLEGILLWDKKHGYASLADIRWGDANLTVVNWSQVKLLGDEYTLQQLNTYDGKAKDRETQIKEYQTAIRANRQLAVKLQDQGLNEDAARFAYRAQKLQRVVLRRQRKFGQYIFSLFLDTLAGYGYKPGRSVLWYLAIIALFAFSYHLFGGLSLYPPDAFVYSLTSFHGRGFFPGLSAKPSLHDPLILLAALEAVIGLLIEISFIATFTQRFFGK